MQCNLQGDCKVDHNRLKKVLFWIISSNQSGFVAGRQIQDNIHVVHEILHTLNHQNEGDDFNLAMKLDMAKAYNRVGYGNLGLQNLSVEELMYVFLQFPIVS